MTYRAEIVVAAGKHGLDPDLVQALVEQESSYEPYAWNPEPRYRYFWNVRTKAPFRPVTDEETAREFPPHDFDALHGDADNEWWAQQASWGLMQVMGAVAREHGFAGPYLPAICDPIVNLDLGCTHLAGLFAWARSDYVGLSSGRELYARRRAVGAYNAGKGGASSPAGKQYALTLLARYDRIRSAGR